MGECSSGGIPLPTFVINLDTRPERLAHIASEFGRFGVPFIRVSAVDGRRLAAAGRINPCLSPGALGCLASHVEIHARIAAGSATHALICEDDIHFAEGFGALMAAAEAWIPADADLVKIEAFEGEVHLGRKPAATFGRHGVHELLSRHMGTGAYVVSRAFAARFAGYDPDTAPVSVDALLFDPRHHPFPGMRVYQLRPAVVIQDMLCRRPGAVLGASDTDFLLAQRREALRAARDRGPFGRLRAATRGLRRRLRLAIRDLAFALRRGPGQVMREVIAFDGDLP